MGGWLKIARPAIRGACQKRDDSSEQDATDKTRPRKYENADGRRRSPNELAVGPVQRVRDLRDDPRQRKCQPGRQADDREERDDPHPLRLGCGSARSSCQAHEHDRATADRCDERDRDQPTNRNAPIAGDASTYDDRCHPGHEKEDPHEKRCSSHERTLRSGHDLARGNVLGPAGPSRARRRARSCG